MRGSWDENFNYISKQKKPAETLADLPDPVD